MINKIELKLILKEIFISLCEFKILEIIKYNISLQKLLKVTIKDYKNMGEKHK